MLTYIMHRTQLSLESWQYEALKARARREGKSLAAVVRDILSSHLETDARRAAQRLEQVAGVAEGPADLGAGHDRYLYGPPRSTSRKR